MSYTLKKSNININPYSSSYKDNFNNIDEENIPINTSIKPIDREFAELEAEKGEYAFDSKKGTLGKFLGNRHAQGGTPVRLPEGSFIFSDYNKITIKKPDVELFKFKKGGTPAKILGREIDVKHHNKMIGITDSYNHDTISKKSAELMLQKNFQKLGQIAFLQEEKKGFPEGIPGFAKGSAPLSNNKITHQEQMAKQYQLGGINPYLPQAQVGIGKNWSKIKKPDWRMDWNSPTGQQLINSQTTNETSLEDNSKPFGDTGDFNSVYDYYNQNFDYKGTKGTNPQAIDEWQKWMIKTKPDELYNYLLTVPLTQKGINLYGRKQPSQLSREQLFNSFNDSKFKYRAPRFQNTPRQWKTFEPSPQPFVPPTPNRDLTWDGGKQPEPTPVKNSDVEPDQPILPYTQDITLTPSQRLDLMNSIYGSVNINKYGPKRMQFARQNEIAEDVNVQPTINLINNQVQQGYRGNAVMNPYIARASNSLLVGKAMDEMSQAQGQNDNLNRQNRQTVNARNSVANDELGMKNVMADNTYYNQVQEMNQNYDNEKTYARNQVFDKYSKYMGDNQQLAMGLMSLPQGTKDIWVNEKTGQISNFPKPGFILRKQAAPIMDFNFRRGNPYMTGAALSLDQLVSSALQDITPAEFIKQTQGMTSDQIKGWALLKKGRTR